MRKERTGVGKITGAKACGQAVRTSSPERSSLRSSREQTSLKSLAVRERALQTNHRIGSDGEERRRGRRNEGEEECPGEEGRAHAEGEVSCMLQGRRNDVGFLEAPTQRDTFPRRQNLRQDLRSVKRTSSI